MKLKLAYHKLVVLVLVCTASTAGNLFAQGGVGINTNGNPPDPSAMFDVTTTDKGALLPRMTEVQRNAIVNPAQGLIIFNTTSNCFNFFKNGSWWEWCGNCIGPQTPVAANNGPLCEGAALNLTASSVPGATYIWTGPNGFSSTQQNPTITNVTLQAGGIYTVVSNLNCNSQPGTTTVTVNAAPASTFTSNPTSPMPGQSCTFSPTVTGASYSWTFQGGTPATSTAQNPVVTWASTGSYSVSLTITQNGCSATTNGSVNVLNCYNHSQSQTFSYTGSVQSWTVPSGVCAIYVDLYGAQGYSGSNQGGLGGFTHGDVPVSAGDVVTIYVGQQGQQACNTYSTNAFGGGGKGYSWNSTCAGGGGGASDIRIGGTALSNRVLVAAGGGGATNNGSCAGGFGGGLTGGGTTCYGTVTGGTQTSGGTGGNGGSLGLGGDAIPPTTDGWVGGGGGGYYGGACGFSHGSGSGGSSYYGGSGTYIPTNTSTTAASRTGNGSVTISW